MAIEQEVERCEYMYVHQDVVNKVKQDMPQDETLYDLAELFKVFVSHQLRVLKNNKLVKFRKEGKNVFYSLADDHVRRIIDQGIEHVEE